MRSTADLVPEYPAMAANAIVAATDAILTTAPPAPAPPPGPGAPPLTRALRPAKLLSPTPRPALCDRLVVARRRLPSGQAAARWASLLLIRKGDRLTGTNGGAARMCCPLFLPVRSLFGLW